MLVMLYGIVDSQVILKDRKWGYFLVGKR